jgi:hypothetical protein
MITLYVADCCLTAIASLPEDVREACKRILLYVRQNPDNPGVEVMHDEKDRRVAYFYPQYFISWYVVPTASDKGLNGGQLLSKALHESLDRDVCVIAVGKVQGKAHRGEYNGPVAD